MKFRKILLNTLLTITLLIITMSFIIENTVVKTFSQEILSKKISGYFLDKIIYDVDINDLGKIENNIRNSKYTYKITSKFIKNVITNVLYTQNEALDITKEVKLLVLENMPEEIYNKKAEDTEDYLVQRINDTESNLLNNFDYYLVILKIYNVITNIYFRLVMLLLCIINIISLVILEKRELLKTIQISILSIAIFTSVICVVIKLLSNFIAQKFAGGWLSTINLHCMIIFIIIEIVISIILFIIRKKLELTYNRVNEL